MEQNFIFAFAQESSNISVGYIERIRPGYEQMPKVYNSFEKKIVTLATLTCFNSKSTM